MTEFAKANASSVPSARLSPTLMASSKRQARKCTSEGGPPPNRHGLLFPDDMADEIKDLNLTINDFAYEVLFTSAVFASCCRSSHGNLVEIVIATIIYEETSYIVEYSHFELVRK